MYVELTWFFVSFCVIFQLIRSAHHGSVFLASFPLFMSDMFNFLVKVAEAIAAEFARNVTEETWKKIEAGRNQNSPRLGTSGVNARNVKKNRGRTQSKARHKRRKKKRVGCHFCDKTFSEYGFAYRNVVYE